MANIHSYDEDNISFHFIDEHAKRASLSDSATMPNLVSYLERPLEGNANHDLFLARAILVWIQSNMAFDGEAKYNTPLHHIKQIKHRRMSPADAFSNFFGAADLKYKIKHGKAKAIRYRAGDIGQHNQWIEFKAESKWYLMHPDWSIQAIEGYSHGDEKTLEADGGSQSFRKMHQEGRRIYLLNDFWFCTAPEIFATRCWPVSKCCDNKKHRSGMLIPSEEKFHSLPDLRQGFYAMQLSLVSENKCVISTKKGKCLVSLLANDDIAKAVEFSYELAMHEDSTNGVINEEALRQLVLHQIKKKMFVFEVRLPCKGNYWLRLYVGYFDQNDTKKRKCCEFKICCETPYEDCQLYPTSCGLGVFGFTPKTENAGLTNPSESGGKLVVKPNSGDVNIERKNTLLTFNLDDSSSSIEYESELYGSDFVEGVQIEKSFTDNVETVKDVDIGKVYVNGHIPKHGEYSLIVNTVDRKVTDGKTRKHVPVACYLVTTHEDKDDKKEERTMSKEMKQIRTRNKRLAKERRKQLLIEERTQITNEMGKLKEELKATETTLELPAIQARLLETVKFENTIKERFPNVSVKIVTNTIAYCGPRGEMNAVEKHLQNTLKAITYVKKHVPPLKAEVCNREEVRLYIWEWLVNEDVEAVYQIEDGVLVVASMVLETAVKAIGMIERLIVERSVTVDEAESNVFTSSEWRNQQEQWKKQYAWQMSIMQLKENTINVCATSSALADLLALILSFLQSHVIVEEPFVLPAKKFQLLQRHHSIEFVMIEIEKKIKVAFIDDRGWMNLQGTRLALGVAKQKMLSLEQRCIQEYQMVSFPGLKSFIRSDAGQDILTDIEEKHQTLIVLAGSDDAPRQPILNEIAEHVVLAGSDEAADQNIANDDSEQEKSSDPIKFTTQEIGQVADDVTLVVYSLDRHKIQLTMQSLNKRFEKAMKFKTIRHYDILGSETVKRIGDIANARNVDYTIATDEIVIKGFPSNVEEALGDLKAEIVGFEIHQQDEELDQSSGDSVSDDEENMIDRYDNDDNNDNDDNDVDDENDNDDDADNNDGDDVDDDEDGEKEDQENAGDADFRPVENDSDEDDSDRATECKQQ